MPDTGVGQGKTIQVATTLAMMALLLKYNPWIITEAYRYANQPVKSCLWLYTFAVVSTVWAYLPEFTFFLALQNVFLLLALFWFFCEFETFEDTEKGFVIFSSLLLVYCFILERLTVTFTLFVHHLSCGTTAAILFSYSCGELFGKQFKSDNRKKILRGAAIMSGFILITSTSAGANISALAGFALAVLFSGQGVFASLLLLASAYLYMNMDSIENMIDIALVGKSKKAIETRSGRTFLWDVIMKVAAEKKIIGWGFGCAERVVTDRGVAAADCHNNYIGFYGGLGIVGCLFFAIHLLSQLFYSFCRRMSPGYSGILCATCSAMVNGYTYGFLSGKASSITVIYFAIVALTYAYSRFEENVQETE